MKSLINYFYVLVLLGILCLAYSIPEIVYPDYVEIDYTYLTEPPDQDIYLNCTSFEAHKKTIEKIEN